MAFGKMDTIARGNSGKKKEESLSLAGENRGV